MVADKVIKTLKDWWGSRRTAFLYMSLFLHFVWLFLFLMIIWMGPYVRILPPPEWLGWCVGCARAVDSIAAASEIGRLDIVSLLLAFLGLIIGLFAFFVYVNVKSSAVDAAKDKTEEWLDGNFDKIIGRIALQVQRSLISEIPDDKIFILTLAKALEQRISNNDADGIAKSMDD